MKLIKRSPMRTRITFILFVINLFLLLLTMILGVFILTKDFLPEWLFLSVGFLSLGFSLFLLLINHHMLRRFQREIRESHVLTEEVNMDHIQRLIDSVRAIKHDFSNHMQVISGLVKTESWETLKEYTSNLVEEIREIPTVFDTKNSILNALLHTKLAVSETKNIEFKVDAFSPVLLDQRKSYQLVKILSNLIDNSIDALQDTKNPTILVTIKRDATFYIISVWNNGPKIPLSIQPRIFDKGFSTKKHHGKNQGLGLYIVKKMINQMSGQIHLTSTDESTCFTIHIPIREK